VGKLTTALARHRSFIDLFDDFPNHVTLFLLQDLASDDYESTRFFTSTAAIGEYR
jgi:hypothetical protein